MKTTVLQLEPHDDPISVKDKMTWGKTERILLVWSESTKVLSRKVDLVLIQRYAVNMGVQLALVTGDSEARFYANKLGIPVFNTVREAQKKNWRAHRRSVDRSTYSRLSQQAERRDLSQLSQEKQSKQPGWIASPIIRLIFFTAGVMALFALAAVLAPGATIILTPEIKTQEMTVPIKVDPTSESIKLTGEIPARVRTVTVEGQKSTPVSGITELPDKPARGEIRIANLSENPVLIPTGLVVLNNAPNPVRFQTVTAGELTAGVGQTITLPIQALFPGVSGNLPENSLVAVEGSLGINVAVNNPLPTSGGTNRPSPVPTDADREKLLESLQSELEQTAREEIIAQLKNNDRLLTPKPASKRLLESAFIPVDNSPADQITLKTRIEYQFLIITSEDIQAFAQIVTTANIPAGYTLVPNTFELTGISVSSSDKTGLFLGRLSFRQLLQAQIEPQQVVNLIQALPIQVTVQKMNANLPLSRPAIIKMSPTWWPKMPLLPIRIRVEIQPVS